MAAAHIALLLCKKKNKSEQHNNQIRQRTRTTQRNEYDLCARESVRVCCVKKSQFFIQSFFFYCFISLSLINLSFHNNSNNNCNKIIVNQLKRYLIFHTKKHTHTALSFSQCVRVRVRNCCFCVAPARSSASQPASVRSVFICITTKFLLQTPNPSAATI